MPDTLDFTKFPTAPATDDPSIHPYRQEIFNKLVSGWTPGRVASILSVYYGMDITEKSVTEYREKIPDEVAIRVPYLHKLLHLIDIEIDPMGEMQRVLKLAGMRLDGALEREEEAKESGEASPAQLRKMSDAVDKANKLYWKFLGDYIERIALIKGAHASRDVLMPTKVPTVREIMAQTAPTERVVDVASKLLPKLLSEPKKAKRAKKVCIVCGNGGPFWHKGKEGVNYCSRECFNKLLIQTMGVTSIPEEKE